MARRGKTYEQFRAETIVTLMQRGRSPADARRIVKKGASHARSAWASGKTPRALASTLEAWEKGYPW